MSEGRRELPEELESLAPGPQLAGLLAGVDRRLLSGEDRVRLVLARNRLIAHQQAELLSDMYAVSRDEEPSSYRDGQQASRYRWTEVELAFALRWTRTAAGYRLEQARQLIEDLPVVHAKLAAGEIDLPKAYVIAELADWLDDDALARQVVDTVIEKAGQLTTGQLRARLRRLVLAVDPDAARRRCATAVKERRVESFGNPDGTGEVWGRNLPAQDAAAVWERLTAIARSAKTTGDGRSMNQLRADALLDLLVGEGVATGGPVGCHTAGLPGADGLPEHQPWVAAEPAPMPAPQGWDPEWPVEPSPQLEPDELASDPAVLAAAGHVPPTPSATSLAGTGAAEVLATGSPVVAVPPRRGVVDVQVPLVTLLRLADLPGELGGWGPVVADIARQIVAQQPDGTWRFSVYDQLGELAFHGITRKRPTAEVAAFVKTRDHTCVAPGCRRPARACDLDHTVAKSDGGHSGPSNVGTLWSAASPFQTLHWGGADLSRTGVFRLVHTTRDAVRHHPAPADAGHR